VVVFLSGRPFHRIVYVEDPHRTHRGIESALLHSKKTAARVSVRSLLPELSDDGVGLTGLAQH
jgi:hypothetical protein